MRAALLLSVLGTLWPRAAGDVVSPARVTWPAGSRATVAWSVPRRPYEDVQRVALPGTATTGAYALPDGRLVVGVWSSGGGGLALVSPAEGSMREVRLPERVSRPLAISPDGTIFAVGDAPTLFVVASDGTLRAQVPLPGAGLAVPTVRRDGTAVVALQLSGSEAELLLVSGDGDPLAHRRVGFTLLGPPVPLGEEVLVPISGGVLRLLPDGSTARSAGLPGAGTITTDGLSVATAAGNAVELLRPDGGLRRFVDLGAPVTWVAPLSAGRTLCLRLGTPPELFLLGASAELLARVPASVSAGRPVEGADGAVVVPAGSGEVLALEPDGRPRWVQRVGDTLRLPAAALPGGGLGLAAPNAVVLLREAPVPDAG